MAGLGAILLRGGYRNLSAFEDYDTIAQGEECIVTPSTDAQTRQERRAALPDEDGPGGDYLSAVSLDAAKLWVGAASVSRGSLAFFMCHCFLPLF